MWLLGRLAPDHKTIADFRKDSGPALRRVCARFVELCREMGLLTTASVAIDGSKFKAVNNRDKNFTRGKVERRRAQLEESVARYLSQLDTADRQEPTEALAAKVTRLTEKLTKLKQEMGKLAVYEKQMLASPDQQISLTDPDSRSMATSGRGSGVVGYNVQVAVDTEHHLIVTHEVTNSGSDRAQLANMGKQAKAVLKTEIAVASDLREHCCFQLGDAGFVAFVECPLLDTLGAQQPCLRQDLQMLAHGRLTHAELFGDQHAADPVLDEVTVDLLAKMRPRAFQPLQDQEPPIAGERAKSRLDIILQGSHIAN